MERDRLKRKLKKQALRNTLFVILGIVLLGVFLFTFGIQLLIHFSVLLTHNNPVDTTNTSQDVNYIAPPDINPMNSATNSAKIKINGTSSLDKATIKLYINGSLEDSAKVNDKNEFEFKSVTLDEGSNEIKAKAETESGKESSYSSPVTILYQNKAPDLTIEYPADGQTLKNDQQTITGKTAGGADVTVNGFRTIVETDGKFSYHIKLQQGGNAIKVISTDSAGNKTEKEINVTFAP